MNNNNQNTNPEFEPSKLLLRWLDGDMSPDKMQDFEKTEEYLQYHEIFEGSTKMEIPKVNEAALFSKIESRIATPEKPKTKTFSLWRLATTAAAVAAIVFVVTNVFFSGISIDSEDAIQMSHILPDGSNIILNTDSQLKYGDDFENERTLSLDGEAFFEVEKGKKFTVQTELGNVAVLGTSFNVFARDEVFTVACKTGKVSVSSQGKVYILTPGERVRVSHGVFGEKQAIDPQRINSWASGESYFESTLLADVVKALSVKYDTEIQLPAAYANKIYTGSFVHNDIEKALKMVFLPMGVTYEVQPDGKVTIG